MLRESHLGDPERSQELLEQYLTGMSRDSILRKHGTDLSAVVVDDAHFTRFAGLPPKHDSPLLVDANAVEPAKIAAKRLQAVARRFEKVVKGACDVQAIPPLDVDFSSHLMVTSCLSVLILDPENCCQGTPNSRETRVECRVGDSGETRSPVSRTRMNRFEPLQPTPVREVPAGRIGNAHELHGVGIRIFQAHASGTVCEILLEKIAKDESSLGLFQLDPCLTKRPEAAGDEGCVGSVACPSGGALGDATAHRAAAPADPLQERRELL